MIKDNKNRRVLVALLMIVGAIFIYLATEAWLGYLLVVLGVLVELIGIKLNRK